MDAVTLDRTLDELSPFVVGRHLARPRLATHDAISFEVGGMRDRWLWLDAGRGTAGVYLLDRAVARSLTAETGRAVPGRARQLLLHLRKHLDGARVSSLGRVAGERVVRLDAGGAALVLRLGGRAPALSLARDDVRLGSLGEGPDAWPPPDEAPEREWDRIDPADFERAVSAARAEGRSAVRAVLFACPGLGPALARDLDGRAASLVALRERLRRAEPHLIVPAGERHDADLADPASVVLLPVAPGPGPHVLRPPSWLEAGALFLDARRRGLELERRRRAAVEEARRGIRRLQQLEANLARDLADLADEGELRRLAEALLAHGRRLEPGRGSVELPDPADPCRRLTVPLDPRLGGVANAERMFDKARRAGRARQQIGLRLRETQSSLAAARAAEARAAAARDLGDLGGGEPRPSPKEDSPGPRHYLTGRGLSVLVGRNARENHHLTFRVARPEDVWLHARDTPGAHVVLRDPEGRAGADDLREAAEVAAFFSEAREASLVDVHVARRKHVRPAKGGPGRVYVAHSDTLRVPPRDPEGRLRRR